MQVAMPVRNWPLALPPAFCRTITGPSDKPQGRSRKPHFQVCDCRPCIFDQRKIQKCSSVGKVSWRSRSLPDRWIVGAGATNSVPERKNSLPPLDPEDARNALDLPRRIDASAAEATRPIWLTGGMSSPPPLGAASGRGEFATPVATIEAIISLQKAQAVKTG